MSSADETRDMTSGGLTRNCNQTRWPHRVGWVYQESTSETRHSVAHKVGAEPDQDLVAELFGIGLVVVLGQRLTPDNVVTV